jgi:RES domain-containing protein
MEAFRITRAPNAELSGNGGLYASGRWHSRGRPIVYASLSRALSILEAIVHTDLEDVPANLVLLTLEIDKGAEMEILDPALLPADWIAPLHPGCMAVGDAWLDSRRTPILRVPSVLVPEESNLLLNPRHPAAAAIRIRSKREFKFDERLLVRG